MIIEDIIAREKRILSFGVFGAITEYTVGEDCQFLHKYRGKNIYVPRVNGEIVYNAKYKVDVDYIFEDLNKAQLHLIYYKKYKSNLNITTLKYIDFLDGTKVTFVQDTFGNIGYSICNPKDQFLKKVGKQLAENRLILNLLDGEKRRAEFRCSEKLSYEYCGYLLYGLYLRNELPYYLEDDLEMFKQRCVGLMNSF
jgi:hypothetical protein